MNNVYDTQMKAWCYLCFVCLVFNQDKFVYYGLFVCTLQHMTAVFGSAASAGFNVDVQIEAVREGK